MNSSEYITRVHDVVFPKRICRACLSVDNNTKFINLKQKYNVFKELLGMEIEPSDLDNTWLCMMCSCRISHIQKFCHSVSRANRFLRMLADQLKSVSNDSEAILTGLERLHFFSSAEKHLSVKNLPQIDISDQCVITDLSSGYKCEVTVPIESEYFVKSENLQCLEADSLMDTELDIVYKEKDSLDNEYEIDPHDLSFGEENVSDINHEVGVVGRRISKWNSRGVFGKGRNPNVVIIYLSKDEARREFSMKALDEKYVNADHKCTLCLKVFSLKSALSAHMEGHSESRGKHECVICHLRFKNSRNCNTHQYLHWRRYKCAKCDYTRISNLCVEEHYVDTHDKAVLEDCKSCGRHFKTSTSKRKHDCQNRAKCDQCGKLVTSSYLETHIARHHSAEKLFNCQICNKKYASEKILDIHQKNIHSSTTGPLYCVECNTTFANKNTFITHQRYSSKHAKDENLKLCPHCPKWMSYWQLKSHIPKEHSKIKSFPCDKCIKIFRTLKALKDHVQKAHEGKRHPKNFVCEICGRAFNAKKILITHMNTHTGARPYKCPLCPASFGQGATLFTHNKLVHLKLKRKLHKKKSKTSEDE